jgi:hypothetical protein
MQMMALRPCHVTGTHNPLHTPYYFCGLQKAYAFDRLLEALGINIRDLPREPSGQGWDHVGSKRGNPIKPEIQAWLDYEAEFDRVNS